MKVLLYGLCLFFLSFVLQLIILKVHLPKRQTKALLLVFFSTMAGGLICISFFSNYTETLGIFALDFLYEYVHIALFFISLTLAYMITYSAIEADSPSLVMIRAVARAGAEGLDKREFEKTMNNELLIVPRVRDLVTDKMAYMEGDKYRLTLKGVLFASIFIVYRKLLNAQKGG